MLAVRETNGRNIDISLINIRDFVGTSKPALSRDHQRNETNLLHENLYRRKYKNYFQMNRTF